MVTSKIIPQNRSFCWEPKLGTLTVNKNTSIQVALVICGFFICEFAVCKEMKKT